MITNVYVLPALVTFGGGNRRYSRKTRLANGRMVYEPKYTVEPCLADDGATYWIIRLYGNILSIGAWKTRAEAVAVIRRLWRPTAPKSIEVPF